jgi:4-hydroxy-tetrahydrodipicolinate reductase
MIKLGLSGSSGRMGQTFKKLIEESEKFTLRAEFHEGVSINNWKAEDIDAVIDFSLPEGLKEVSKWCFENQKPLITGTTGFENVSEVIDVSNLTYPLMHSGNYSLGIASLIQGLKSFKALSQDATVWIEDYHHKHKKDSPSGTALKISNAIKEDLKKEVQINDVRAGSIFGVHKVHIATDEEWVTLSHTALNREVFAKGALKVIPWLIKQPSGSYSLEDFINSN